MFGKIKKSINESMNKWIGDQEPVYEFDQSVKHNVNLGRNVKLYDPVRLYDVKVGDYSYVGIYSHLKNVDVGKFCSIGPRCFFGWGIHPTNGISTSPMFYSTFKQNGMSLSAVNKIVEEKRITIGHDVFIGMNATILDGVTIGNGAVIGAGAVVAKDIPPYAIAVGNPVKILKYRFSEEVINSLLKIRWWDFPDDELLEVENNFFDVEGFVRKMSKK